MDLSEVLRTQALLQVEMGLSPMLRNGEIAIKEATLAGIVEWTEVLNEINWKPWRKTKKAVDKTKLAEELCDVLQFWANAVNAASVTPEEVAMILRNKWKVNRERIANGY